MPALRSYLFIILCPLTMVYITNSSGFSMKFFLFLSFIFILILLMFYFGIKHDHKKVLAELDKRFKEKGITRNDPAVTTQDSNQEK